MLIRLMAAMTVRSFLCSLFALQGSRDQPFISKPLRKSEVSVSAYRNSYASDASAPA